jgi:hypothetical protein
MGLPAISQHTRSVRCQIIPQVVISRAVCPSTNSKVSSTSCLSVDKLFSTFEYLSVRQQTPSSWCRGGRLENSNPNPSSLQVPSAHPASAQSAVSADPASNRFNFSLVIMLLYAVLSACLLPAAAKLINGRRREAEGEHHRLEKAHDIMMMMS